MPAVSIIIPTYNHRDLVMAALDSVFAQTFTDYEVIVIDDGSPDDTAELLKPLVNQQKIRLIRQPNSGQAAARNRGIAEATGEFIALLDDDDLWPTDKLTWQVQRLRDDPAAAAVGGAVESVTRDGVLEYAAPMSDGEIDFEMLFNGLPFWSPGQTLIRADALRSVGPLDTTVPGADDYDLWLRLCRVGRILIDSRLSLRYRRHSGNASNNLPKMYRSCREVVRRHTCDLPSDVRRRLNRSVDRWLYDYLGSNALNRLLADIRQLSLRGTVRSLWLWARLVRSAASDRMLRSAVRKDLHEVCAHRWPFRLFTDRAQFPAS